MPVWDNPCGCQSVLRASFRVPNKKDRAQNPWYRWFLWELEKKTVPFLDRSSPTILFLTNKMKRQLLVQVAPRHTGERIYCVSGTQNICAWIRTYFQSLCGRSSNLDSFEKQGFSGMIHSFLSHGTSWDQCQPSLLIPVLVKHGNGTSPSDRWFHHL